MKIFIILILIKSLYAMDIKLDPSNWKAVKYDSIKANEFNYNNELIIKVNKSSSPLVYKLNNLHKTKEILIRARMQGTINYSSKAGSDKNDDFPLRVGLITKGDNQLNFFQRSIAPKWILKLNKLGNQYGGFDKIHSFILYSQIPEFQERLHPLSEYFMERVLGKIENDEKVYKYKLPRELDVIGIWLTCDGDDTDSSFTVFLSQLSLN